jgi:hypothetical protein
MSSHSRVIDGDNILSELYTKQFSDVSDESTEMETLYTNVATTSSGKLSQACPVFVRQ